MKKEAQKEEGDSKKMTSLNKMEAMKTKPKVKAKAKAVKKEPKAIKETDTDNAINNNKGNKRKLRKPQTVQTNQKKGGKSPAGKKRKAEAEEEKASGEGKAKAKRDKKEPKEPKDKKEEREMQKKRKETRQKKAKSEDVYALGVEVKKMWETLRREDCNTEERNKLTEALHEEVKGKLLKLLFAHDTVRPLECLVALGGERIRDELFNEVKDCLVSVAKAPYGHFFLVKLLKYGSKDQRAAIFKTFRGRVADLTKHKVANNIVESLYNDYANAQQRNHMLQEFCGPEFRAFKEDDVRTVAQLIEKHPTKERDIIRHLQDNVNTLIQKGCYNHSLVHTVIYNYLQVSVSNSRSERGAPFIFQLI